MPKAKVPPTNTGPSMSYVRGQGSPLSAHVDQTAEYKNIVQKRIESASERSGIPGTPARASSRPSGSSGIIRRPETEKHLANSLAHRRCDSDDLVEHAFGDLIPIPLATRILLTLLRHQVLAVEVISDAEDLPHGQQLWIDACLDAATLLSCRLHQEKPPAGPGYKWKWVGIPDGAGTEEGTADFLNALGALSYAIAQRLDTKFSSQNTFRNRFVCLKKHTAFPGWGDQDSRPDIVAIPVDSFQSTKADTPANFVSVSTPANLIGQLVRTDEPSHPSSDLENENGGDSTSAEETAIEALRRDLEEMLLQKSDIISYPLPPHSLLDQVDPSRVNWANLTVTGEAKSRKGPLSIRQAFIYMEMKRQVQPHLRYVLGLGATQHEVALIRADAIGTEECRLAKHVGWGVLDIVRLALGLAIADPMRLGVHPFFELEEELSEVSLSSLPASSQSPSVASQNLFAPVSTSEHSDTSLTVPVSEGTSTSTKRKRMRNDEIPTTREKRSRSEKPLCKARKAIFIAIPDEDDPSKKTRYFLDHLADNPGGLVGRSTRVWCAYQEVSDKEMAKRIIRGEDIPVAEAQLASGGRVFVGPYALKLQNFDVNSVSYTQDISSFIKKKAEAEPNDSRHVLLPERTWKHSSILHAVRGLTPETVPTKVQKRLLDRREIFTVSLYKRTLSHYKSFPEVLKAVSDVLQAILWLDKHRIAHRDISRGNILLAQEEPTAFTGPRQAQANGVSITLCRRKLSQTPGVHGMLHDLDMAYIRPDPVVQEQASSIEIDNSDPKAMARAMAAQGAGKPPAKKKQKEEDKIVRFFTGTPPYMALEVLYNSIKSSHNAHHDVESLFYVLYLFPFDAHPPPRSPVYPNPWTKPPLAFDSRIANWVRGTDLKQLGDSKFLFFGPPATENENAPTGEWHKVTNFPSHIRTLWSDGEGGVTEDFVTWLTTIIVWRGFLWKGRSPIPSDQTDIEAIAKEVRKLADEVSV